MAQRTSVAMITEQKLLLKKDIQYQDGEALLKGKIFYPPFDLEKYPSILLFPAFEGQSAFADEYAKILCYEGYVVFIADIYGEGRSASTIPDCFELIKPFLQDRILVRNRSLAAFHCLKQQNNVDVNNIGGIGFCFGGQCLLEVARAGVDLKAGVSAHGMLARDTTLTLQPIKTNLLILHGFADPQVPNNHLLDFQDEMTLAQVKDWNIIIFGQAQHSFTDPKTGTFDPELEQSMGRVYDKTAAARTQRYAIDFFNEHLKKSS
jgi:dienelactone hydrolase